MGMTNDLDVVRTIYERVFVDLASEPAESALLELSHPDVEIDLSRQVFNPAVYRGHDEVRTSIGDVREAWETFKVTPREFMDAGELVLVTETVNARGRGSGVEITSETASTYRLRDGKITHVTVYPDRSEAFEAAGLPRR
jgi:ketosteroid isomerase-like protein